MRRELGRSGAGGVPRRAALKAALATLAASVAAACGSSSVGQKPGTASPATPDAAGRGAVVLSIVGILTADLNRSLAFYRRLGLEVPESTDGDSYRLRLTGDHVLFWETPSAVLAFDPSWSLPPSGGRRIVLEFGYATTDDLQATYRELTAHGAPTYLAPFDLGEGIRYAIVEDPDGNQISLRYPATS